jgi:hypothetical protein
MTVDNLKVDVAETLPVMPPMARQWKRDLIISVAVGACIELILWACFYLAVTTRWPTAIDNVMWLDSLQEPAEKIGLPIALKLKASLGLSGAVRIASICGFSLLIAAWSVGVFLTLKIYRLCHESNTSSN